MNLYQRFYYNFLLRPTSWKNAARLNCVVLVFFIFPLFALTMLSFAKPTNNSQFLMLRERPCHKVSMINKGLHLVLNMVSSLILASSNFFMQILNAPSRSEIDRAHKKGSWLEIGVPSLRNTFRVSWVKTAFWLILFLSSIPLHLVFNSAIFQVDRIMGDFNMTVASQSFLNGAPYSVPGASMSPMWVDESSWVDFSDNGTFDEPWTNGVYTKPDIEKLANHSTTSRDAITTSLLQHPENNWDRLTASDCYRQYSDSKCSGIRTHKDVIVILSEPDGWARNETWILNANQTAFWDLAIPNNKEQRNSLWFFNSCRLSTRGYAGNFCDSDCLPTDPTKSMETNASTWITDSLEYAEVYGFLYNATTKKYHTLQMDSSRLRLLLVVLICVVVKAMAAVAVTRTLSRQPDESLVTIGDALASFIRKPDDSTRGRSTCNQSEAKSMTTKSPRRDTAPGPRAWCNPRRRLGSCIKRSIWAVSYTLIGFGIAFAAGWIIFGSGVWAGVWGITDSFGPSERNQVIDINLTFLNGVLLANCPQILLSFCYLVYNQLFTRLLSALEVAKYGTGFWPLRVTEPEGCQYSTYRLQLPYRYSIPLIVVSTVLHWLLSNSMYLMASEGNYVKPFGEYDSTFPFPIAISVGYSLRAGVVMCVVSIVISMAPIVLALRKLPSGMNNIGNNSLALSAACHASTLSAAVPHDRPSTLSKLSSHLKTLSPSARELSSSRHGSELAISRHDSEENWPTVSRNDSTRPFLPISGEISTEKTLSSEEQTLLNVSRSRIRWGVIRMPPEWYRDYETSVVPVEHLGFGVEEDGVESPVKGKYYA